MRLHFRILAGVAVALFASSGSVWAQTGEFASPVPGSVVHAGYGLQDWLQDLRNGARKPPPPAVVETVQAPPIILPPQVEPVVRPKKTARKTRTNAQVQQKQPQ
jgi:hypothetical protein